MYRNVIPTVAIAALVLPVAACTSGGHPKATATTAAPVTTATSSSVAPVIPQNSTLPTSVANDVSLRSNVAVTSCAQTADGWQASGTVTNTGGSSKPYLITVFFTSPQATVEDYATTTVTVKAGAHQTWQASKSFPAVPGTLCVLRGVAPGK